MADPFVGEIKMFSFNWVPRGWALCNGAQLAIQQNAALYSLIGIQFGGNGSTTFNLPDLRGRTPVCSGNQYMTGNALGVEAVTLDVNTMPPHTHAVYGSSAAANKGVAVGANDLLAVTTQSIYSPGSGGSVAMNPATVSSAGGGQGHNNMQPSLVTNFCIALTGTYPMRN